MVLDLRMLGWDAERDEELAALDRDTVDAGRVSVQHRGAYDVLTREGEIRCEAAPRLVRAAEDAAGMPAVGDWVALDRGADGRRSIVAVLERRSRFSRLAAHDPASETTREQVVAANIDVVFVVTSLNEDLSPRRLERYLTLAWQSGARPVVLLTKADLVADPSDAIALVGSLAIGVPIHALSTVTGTGLEAVLAELGPGVTAALLGSSGVGKSTLANALAGTDRMATAEIRADGKGRHTTTRRELIVLPEERGLLIDTPGMRELQLWVADEGLAEAFEDVTSLFGGCRFSDCAHDQEPGCAVKAALADGRLAPERWESYLKLQRELEMLERRLDKRAASEDRRRWRAMDRTLRALYRDRERDR